MPAAPHPHDEAARLEALYALDILDTPAEARFDRLTRLAQRMFQAPIVLISLVDADRQWFKSCIGLDGRETSRDVSFCAHALLRPEASLIILDARQDERFAGNALVTGAPYIRFYAGHVLRSPDGQPLGTLCIIDPQPRAEFSADDQRALADLAALVEQEFARSSMQQAQAARAQAEAALADSAARFGRMARNVPGMVYQFALRPDGQVSFPFVSEGARDIYELEPAEIMADAALIIARIVPEHQASFQQSVDDSAATLQLWQWQGRMRTPAGREKWLQAQSRPTLQPDGVIVWDGVLQDITHLKALEAEQARFMALANAAPDFIAMVNLENRPIYMNPAGRSLVGLGADEALDATLISEFHPAATMAILEQAMPIVLETGRWVGETALLARDGREIPVSQVILCHRDGDGQVTHFSTMARDLTRQRQAETTERALQEEIIQIQARAIAELSTPLITLTDHTVLMPLIGAVDSARAQQMLDTLLQGVSSLRARVAILDLTGVPVIDTRVAAALIHAAQAVRLLGAEVILTGIRPEIAQTLVALGVDVRGVRTHSELHHGIAYALAQSGEGKAAPARPRW